MTAHLARHRMRARRRGASAFLVIALIAALSGIGAFAARAALTATAASGHSRAAAQAHLLTAYALQATVAELGTPRGPAYVEAARLAPPGACAAGQACFTFGREQLELVAGPLLDPPSAPRPGSLGRTEIGWSCRIEMSDPMPAMPPPPGFDETSAGAAAVRPVMVTLGATGVLWPAEAGAGVPGPDPELAAATAVRAELRAHAVVRGVPR